jgi:hypothetical protein
MLKAGGVRQGFSGSRSADAGVDAVKNTEVMDAAGGVGAKRHWQALATARVGTLSRGGISLRPYPPPRVRISFVIAIRESAYGSARVHAHVVCLHRSC